MIVADASAVIELVLATPRGRRVRDILLEEHRSLHAPHLLDLEVVQVLRRYERSRDLDRARAQVALDVLGALPIRRYPHRPFLARVWQLRRTMTAYDAVYVALAEALPATLVTLDRRLARASGHRAAVELL